MRGWKRSKEGYVTGACYNDNRRKEDLHKGRPGPAVCPFGWPSANGVRTNCLILLYIYFSDGGFEVMQCLAILR